MSHLTYFKVVFHTPFKCTDFAYARITRLTHKTLPSARSECGCDGLVLKLKSSELPLNALTSYCYFHASGKWIDFCDTDCRMPAFFLS